MLKNPQALYLHFVNIDVFIHFSSFYEAPHIF